MTDSRLAEGNLGFSQANLTNTSIGNDNSHNTTGFLPSASVSPYRTSSKSVNKRDKLMTLLENNLPETAEESQT